MQPAEERSVAAAGSVQVEEAEAVRARGGERVRYARRDLDPVGRRRHRPAVDGERQLALEHVEGLDVAGVQVQRRRRALRIAGRLRDRDGLGVGQQLDPQARAVRDDAGGTDHRLCHRASAVGRRLVLVPLEGLSIAERTKVARERRAGGVEVEEAELAVAAVAEAVDDVRRHAGQRPGGQRHGVVVDPQAECQLSLEHVEQIGVTVVHVELGALTTGTEPRPRRRERPVVGEDLDPPPWRVADELAGGVGDGDG